MSLVLTRILDPRDALDRANRDQMREYAEKNGIKEITWDMAGNQMRAILRSLKILDIGLPHVQLGTRHAIPNEVPSGGPSMNLDDLEKQQWKQQAQDKIHEERSAKTIVPVDPTKTRAQLAHECKARGIKMSRKDTKEILIEKLNGQPHSS